MNTNDTQIDLPGPDDAPADLPLAASTGADPSNEDIEALTAPLDPNDDVFSLVNPEAPEPVVDAPPVEG